MLLQERQSLQLVETRVRESYRRPMAILFLCTTLLTYWIQLQYFDLEVIAQDNTIFDADGVQAWKAISQGTPDAADFRHPIGVRLLNYLFVRGPATVLAVIGQVDVTKARQHVALWVIPLLAGLKAAAVYYLAVLLGLGARQRWFLTLLSIGALSAWSVGSMPESYTPSALLHVVLCILLILEFHQRRWKWDWPWWLVAFFAIGTTVTNAVYVGLAFLFVLYYARRNHPVSSALHSGVLVCFTVAIVIATGGLMHKAWKLSPGWVLPHVPKFVDYAPDRHQPAREITVAMADTFAAGVPFAIVPHDFEDEPEHTLNVAVTLNRAQANSPRNAAWLFVFSSLLVGGFVLLWKRRRMYRVLAVYSAIVILFCFVMHLRYYMHDMYLYALHWQTAMLILLSGWFFLRREAVRAAVIGSLVAASFASSIYYLVVLRGALNRDLDRSHHARTISKPPRG